MAKLIKYYVRDALGKECVYEGFNANEADKICRARNECCGDWWVDEEEVEGRYEIWALGYDKDEFVTDYEKFVGEYEDLDEAQEAFEEISRKKEEYLDLKNVPKEIHYIYLQLETIEDHGDWDENIETQMEQHFERYRRGWRG